MSSKNDQNKLLKPGYLLSRELTLSALIFILGFLVGFLIGNKEYLESANIFVGIVLLIIYILIIYIYVTKLIKSHTSEQKKIEQQLSTDQLTQLYNKEYFYGLFEIELSRAARYRRHLSCILMEIDDIHDIFDKYGDKYGDRVLKNTAEILKDNSRITDVLARFDGYQFICLLTETDMHSTIILCKRLRSLLASEECETDEGQTIFITTSIGITNFNPDIEMVRGIDIFKMIKATRKALDTAKERGGNRIEDYDLSNL